MTPCPEPTRHLHPTRREVCWNDGRGQCVNCSPHMAEEVSAIESEATIASIRERAHAANLGAQVPLQSAAGPTECPECRAKVELGTKFCGECGYDLRSKPKCPACGHELASAAKFCGECGNRLP
jgi:membrane protease subunit (stomatin/prohibitin family)